MSRTLLLKGKEVPVTPPESTTPVDDFPVAFAPSREVLIGANRGEASEIQWEKLEDDTLLEIEYGPNAHEWVTVGELHERLGRRRSAALRSDDRIDISFLDDSRGFGSAIQRIRTLAAMTLDKGKLVAKGPGVVAALGARQIAAKLEGKLFEGNRAKAPGLYYVNERFELIDEVTAKDKFADEPYLVLLHGTFSSTAGSFSDLFQSADWQDLKRAYGDGRRILALEHRSLTENPAQNALAAASVLPRNARLHFISHSRGGLIGELFCRGPVDKSKLELFSARDTAAEDKETLADLSRYLAEKNFAVERFVRVACPALGTLLAADRASEFLSIILDAIGLIPVISANPFAAGAYTFVRQTILSLIQTRTDPKVLPGLEAMMPQSAFIRLLNDPSVTTDADLAVISGNSRWGGVKRTIMVLAARLYYLEKNDFVVHTAAMYGGVRRPGGFYYGFHQSDATSHFAYFADQRARAQLKSWLLTSPGQEPPKGLGFVHKTPPPAVLAADRLRSAIPAPPPKPTAEVVVVPGIFESMLVQNGKPAWFDYAALATDGLEPLEGASGVLSAGLVPELYEKLVRQLTSRGYQVTPLHYDWRKSLTDAASSLADTLELALVQADTPIHVMAHGAGCLVVALAFAGARDLAARLAARGGRSLLLAPPAEGSVWASALLEGKGPAFDTLVLLNPTGDADAVKRTLNSFLSLRELASGDKGEGAAIRATAAKAAFSVGDSFAISGYGVHTPSSLIDGQLLYHEAGDGMVLLPGAGSATPALFAGVQQFYVRAAHGNLLDNLEVISSIGPLLENRSAPQLSTSCPPVTSPAAQPLDRFVLYPTAEETLNTLFVRQPPREEEITVSVQVTHDDLRNASHPVIVGHYATDTIVGAERALDEALQGALSRRHGLDLYPGGEGSFEIFLSPDCRPPGGMVIGLGEVGEISQRKLTLAFSRAVLRYALTVCETKPRPEDGSPRSAKISTVFIGTLGGQPLTLEQSITAILHAIVGANTALREQRLADEVRIDTLEFIEIYQDHAIQAAHFLRDWDGYESIAQEFQVRFIPPQQLRPGFRGRMVTPTRRYYDGWWRRIQVAEREALLPGGIAAPVSKDGRQDTDLVFTVLTDRARAEESIQGTQQELIQSLVAQVQGDHSKLSDLSVTLFELLVPNELKDQSGESSDLVLVVDKKAARFPWEMMAERRPEGDPEPLAKRFGMIRQLKLTEGEYRQRIQASRGSNALVIGNPQVDRNTWINLDGAKREAEEVCNILNREGFDTSRCQIERSALEIMNALFAAEYRIIHIAAHGHFNKEDPGRSGVVLGDRVYLTAREIAKLRRVPELVFLNCCHLARVEDLPSYASGIAEELIRIGVRAVVAAGWAVSDEEGKRFAEEFYRRMLAGETYGAAVKAARATLLAGDSRTNTWGAYQCYGDPGFVLRPAAVVRHRKDPVHVYPIELQQELDEMPNRANGASPSEVQRLRRRLKQLEETSPKDWFSGRILYHLGSAYGELADFSSAVNAYERAAAHEDARASIKAIEQLANLYVRHGAFSGEKALVEKAIQLLEWTRQLPAGAHRLSPENAARAGIQPRPGDTPERLGLLGGALKRLALFHLGQERVNYLAKSCRYYYAAYLTRRLADPQFTVNLIAFRWFDSEAGNKAPDMPDVQLEINVDSLLVDTGEFCRQKGGADFFANIAQGDLAVLEALRDGNLAARLNEILPLFQKGITAGGTPKQRSSVLEQLVLMRTLLEGANSPHAQPLAEIARVFASTAGIDEPVFASAKHKADAAKEASQPVAPPKAAAKKSEKKARGRKTKPGT